MFLSQRVLHVPVLPVLLYIGTSCFLFYYILVQVASCFTIYWYKLLPVLLYIGTSCFLFYYILVQVASCFTIYWYKLLPVLLYIGTSCFLFYYILVQVASCFTIYWYKLLPVLLYIGTSCFLFYYILVQVAFLQFIFVLIVGFFLKCYTDRRLVRIDYSLQRTSSLLCGCVNMRRDIHASSSYQVFVTNYLLSVLWSYGST